MTIETVTQNWHLKLVEDEGLFIKIGDTRFKTKTGHLTEQVLEISSPTLTKKQRNQFVQICFKVPSSNNGKGVAKFDVKNYQEDLSTTLNLKPSMTAAAFIAEVKKQAKLPPDLQESASATMSPTATTSTKKNVNLKRTSTKTGTADVELPSPEKKFRPCDIDQKIDSAYIGHFHLKVESLSDFCPEKWIDRSINTEHVQEIEEQLRKNPTLLKNQQPWIGMTDLTKAELAAGAKSAIKGCQITVIGGRHRQAAYKKVSTISSIHAQELDKVWIDLYGSELEDEEVRRLACTHNTTNKGSMPTNFATRVHACRQWLYQLSGKDQANDETPASTQKWKIECQKMYAPVDKDPNTLEPTLQAALLSKDVFSEFSRICEMFKNGSLKDQKTKKRGGKTEITQNQLGMPLQGLSDESKLTVLREVSSKNISLKEMKKKCDRIKKKKLVVTAFMKHAGESMWDSLRRRFPLHTTEEKIGQFSECAISKTKTPQEVINFFEKAMEWEKKVGPINLQEEREGIFLHRKDDQYGILMEGSTEDIGAETIRRIVGSVPFKGFSLMIASLSRDLTTRNLQLFLNCVHAANVDNLNNYTVVLFVPSTMEVDPIKTTLQTRFGVIETAYWIDLKRQRVQGKEGKMSNSVHPIIIGYWTKGGAAEVHSHFEDDDDCSNAFCFPREEKECLPKDLLTHVINHFSLEGQWVLDMSNSKDAGLVATLSSKRNCVSLMESAEALRETAKASAVSISRNNDLATEDVEDQNDNNELILDQDES